MHPNSEHSERVQSVFTPPLDMLGVGISAPAINMRDVLRAQIVFLKNNGTAGQDPVITVTQGDGISSGALLNGKALNFTRVKTKLHTSVVPHNYTLVEQAAGNTFTSGTLAEEEGEVVIEITPDMLDVDGGFHAIRATIANPGAAAQIATLGYRVEMKRWPVEGIQADA